MRQTWQCLNELMTSKNSSRSTIKQLIHNKVTIDNPDDIPEIFNEFFANVGSNLDKEIPKTPISPLSYMGPRVEGEFQFSQTTVPEVMMLLMQLDDRKSTGHVNLPVRLLKIAAEIIVPRLVSIYNLCLRSGVFPKAMKIAKIVALFKAGCRFSVTNYRPISLLPVFSKIFEKIVHKQVSNYLELKKIIFESQFGFQKKKSTLHSLIDIVENIRDSLERGNYGCGIFIDLKKAFDTVNHRILIQKLEHYGIRGTALKWFTSYLSERTQYTFINGKSSSILSVSCGVPQGSVLGPLLFLLYINDLPNISKRLQFFLFADDTNIFFEHSNLATLQRIVNKELKKLSLWLNANRLALNISKTNFVIFAAKNKPLSTVTILLNKKAIEEKKYVKYLGVLIDSQLTFKYHISGVTKKLSQITGTMSRIRNYVDSDTCKLVYNGLGYSKLLYGLPVWGNADEVHIKNIVILQKKAVRIIVKKNCSIHDDTFERHHSAPIFKDLGILHIRDVFVIETLKFVYDSLNKINPPQFHEYFKLPTSSRNNTVAIRNNNLVFPRARTTTYGLKSLKYCGVLIWNGLDVHLRTKSRAHIIDKVKKSILERYR